MGALNTDTTISGIMEEGNFTESGSGTGGSSLIKIGTGTLTLTAANTYTGTTTINSGTLQLGDGVNSNGSVTGNIVDNATLTFANPTAQTYNGVISGTGSVNISGPGNLTLAGANTYTGGTTISSGTVVASGGNVNGGTLQSGGLGAGAVSIASGATLSVGEAVNTTGGAVSTGSLTIASLTVASLIGNTTPALTFNLGATGTNDLLTLMAGTSAISFSGAGSFLFGFASATGAALSDGSYDLFSFGTPQLLSSLPSFSSFSAKATGNLADINGSQFVYLLNSNGQATGLQYSFLGADVTPEPGTCALLLSDADAFVGLSARRLRLYRLCGRGATRKFPLTPDYSRRAQSLARCGTAGVSVNYPGGPARRQRQRRRVTPRVHYRS